MTREEFVKQRCEIDKITEEEFEKKYRVVDCNCGEYYCKGYKCLDLDGLLKENQELKEQVEECKDKINWYENFEVNKTIDQLRLKHNIQQKEFIKYLEDEIKQNTPSLRWKHYNEDGFNDYDVENPSCIEVRPNDKIFKEILKKYKEIIGVLDEKK